MIFGSTSLNYLISPRRIGMHGLSMALSDFYSLHADYKTRLLLHPIDSNGSVVDAAAAALQLLRDVKVDAIIGPQTSSQVNFVMDLGDRAHVPIISFSATSPSLSHRTPYFVQTAQSDVNQVEAIASIIKEYHWTQVVVIFEDTEYGRGIMPSLSNALQDVNARIPYRSMLPRSSNDDYIRKELHKMMSMQTRVFVVHLSPFLGTSLFPRAREVGMMSDGYVWIITSGLTDLFSSLGSDVAEAMQGVLGVRPLIPKSKRLNSSIFGVWAYDSLWALGMAAERVGISRSSSTVNEGINVNLTTPFSSGVSETGPELLQVLLDTRFTGLAGEFNLVNGQLEQTAYEIVNVVENIERPVGSWTPHSTLKGNFSSIIWPGDSTKAPRGWEHPIKGKKLRIAVPQKPGFNEFLKVETDPRTNKINVSGHYKDLFDSVMNALPYDLPYDFLPYPFVNADGSRTGSYDDLVHQVSLMKDYDGALGDISITANRSDIVDFTMPYAEGGIACIVPIKYEDVDDVFTFLQPLSIQLWVTTVVLYISNAVVIWILAKRLVQSSRDSLAQQAGLTCLFPFFPGQGIRVSLICVIVVTWAFVANLLYSTYTASLASRLTIARLIPTVTNVNQLIANGDYVGYQHGSFLEKYLMDKKFHQSKIKNYTSVDDCEKDLSLGSISAYCDVLPHIRSILSNARGKYMIIDPIYRTDGFAFAFYKGFPAVADISRAIVKLIENDTIGEKEQQLECLGPDGSSGTGSPTRVSLRSFSVLYAITSFVTLSCLLVSHLIHLHNNRSLRHRITEFHANACSKILAFRNYFKPNKPSSLPATTEDTLQVEEFTFSNDHIIEVEVMPQHH